jgi:hypothetical protein
VVHNKWTNHDLESTPIEIKTDSLLVSSEEVYLDIHNQQSQTVGNFLIRFQATVQYYISGCAGWKDFPKEVPNENEKIWRIAKLPGPKLIVHCNNVEVLSLTLTSPICPLNGWHTWNKKASKISFIGADKASDFYRSFKGNKFLYSKLIA